MGRLIRPNGIPEEDGLHYSAHIGESLTFDINTAESQRIATHALSLLYRATAEGLEASNTFGFITLCQGDCGQSPEFYCDMVNSMRNLELIVFNEDGDIELTPQGLSRAEGNYMDEIVTGGYILTQAEERQLYGWHDGILQFLQRHSPPPLEPHPDQDLEY